MNRCMLFLACVLLFIATTQSGMGGDTVLHGADDVDRCAPIEDASGPLFEVESWLCVYQNVGVEDIVAVDVDLVDVDPDGFSRGDVAAMRDSGKIVLAYISIGEAEEYRYYWNPDADYLLEENPDWAGNWYVDFSSQIWRSLIIDDYIPRIRDQGFDGLYLDTLETYHLEDRYPCCSRGNMTDFVRSISEAYRSPSFYIVAQNGLEIVSDIAAYIDGVGVEETYCRAVYLDFLGRHVNGVPQRPAITASHEDIMDGLLDEEKLVLTLDYAILRCQVARCYERSREQGYVPYVSTAALDRIWLPPDV